MRKPALARTMVNGIFTKLAIRYPNQWKAPDPAAKPEAYESWIGEWSMVLAGLEPEQIKRGLASLPPEGPPNAHRFRDLCRGYAAGTPQAAAYALGMYSRPPELDKRALPAPDGAREHRKERSKKVAAREIAEMRAKLGVTPNQEPPEAPQSDDEVITSEYTDKSHFAF